ncbi:MAG: thioredoxin domain-containing protein [Proteobacteria bacterium]|nr:thioredoxin domain-containing protein [Pseudomonadota bacterium]
MQNNLKLALAGGLAGAVIAVAAVIGLSLTGNLPGGYSNQKVSDYLMSNPEILAAMSAKLQMRQEAEDTSRRQAAVEKLGLKAFFNPKVAFVTGPEHAKVTLVEFFDYNCVHCRNSLAAMKKFYAAHKDARYAFIDFPIFGDDSILAARAAIAARQQPDKYVDFHFALLGTSGPANADSIFAAARAVGLDMKKLQADMNDPTLPAKIDAAHALAQAAAVDGTPTFVINGKVHPGEVNDALLAKLVKG